MEKKPESGSSRLLRVINDFFGEDKDVFETAMYAMSTIVVQDQIASAVMLNKTEVSMIPPESLILMRRYENGLTTNKFFLENFGPIKSAIALADIKISTIGLYLAAATKHPEDKEMYHDSIKAVMLTKLDVLTLIALLWKGIEFAEDFDSKFRVFLRLNNEFRRVLG